jgi:hypothetical protein
VALIASKTRPHWTPELCPPTAIGAAAGINKTRRVLLAGVGACYTTTSCRPKEVRRKSATDTALFAAAYQLDRSRGEPNPWMLIKAVQQLKSEHDRLKSENDLERSEIKVLLARLHTIEEARR